MREPLITRPGATAAQYPGGEMEQRINQFPWEASPIDVPANWPPVLRFTLRTILSSPLPMVMLCGRELICLYNDAYHHLVNEGEGLPNILGLPAPKALAPIWEDAAPIVDSAMQGGSGGKVKIEKAFMREGSMKTISIDLSSTAVVDDEGNVEGVLLICQIIPSDSERYSNLVQQIKSPLVICKGPELLIEEGNQPFFNFWRKDRTVIGHKLAQVLPDLEDQGFIEILRQVYNTGEDFIGLEVPTLFEAVEGRRELFYWNLQYTPYRECDGTITGVIAMATDVTESVLAKNRLAIAEDEMRVALEAANIGYWNVNPSTSFLQCNRKTKELFGLPPDEEVELSLAIERIHPMDRQRVQDRIKEALDHSSGGHYDVAYRVISINTGEVIHVRAIGKTYFSSDNTAYRFSGTVQDITASKKAEEKLIQSEYELRTVKDQLELSIRAGKIGTWHWDVHNNKLQWSREQEKIYGLEPGSFGGRYEDFHAMVVPEDLERLRQIPQHELDSVEGSQHFFRIRRKDGATRWIHSRSKAVRDEEDTLLYISGTNIDVTEERNAAEALRKSEEKYRGLFEHIDQGFCIIDVLFDVADIAYDYRFAECNIKFEEQSGLKNAVGKTMKELVPDIEDYWAKRYGEVHKSGKSVRFVEGSAAMGRWFDIFAFRIGIEGSYQVAVLFSDITARKLAEEQLREQQLFTQSIIEASPSLTYIFDMEQGSNAFSSPQIVEILGYSNHDVEEMGASLLAELLHPEDVAGADERFERIMADVDNEIYEVEYRMRHKSGNWVWLFDRARVFKRDEEGKPVQILGVANEVTNRKKAEADLLESETRFRSLANTLPQLVWLTDKKGNVIWLNERWEAYFGKQHTNDTWVEILHPDDAARAAAQWRHSVETGADYEIEYRLFEKLSGTYRWFLGKAVPLRNSEGSVVSWFGTCTEIHDQKMMTEKLEALVTERTAELQRSNEDLQQFAHVASHDLKEPVRKIRTFMNQLEDELKDNLPGRSNEYINKVQRAAGRMSAMIDGVLQYSYLGSKEIIPEPVDLNTVIDDVSTDLELAIQQRAALINCAELHPVLGSPVLFYQLFYNLLNNSLKFSDPGRDPVISIYSQLSPGDEKVQIIVEDNGIGFRPEEAELIFGTFTRLHSKDKYEGTGLGLALCQKIVERHGGTIRAEGKEGEGARFIIELKGVKN